MLKRLYVDNFRALVNSELFLEARTLLMGRNGSGKSTFGEVLVRIQALLVGQSKTDVLFGAGTLCRWQRSPRQQFELDVSGPGGSYRYKLIIEHHETTGTDQPRTRIISEILTWDSKPLFRFEEGLVHLFRDDHSVVSDYPFDWGRSALATIAPRHDNQKLSWFVTWIRGMTVVRANPQLISGMVERDEFILRVEASNFAAWYHTVSAADKRRDQMLHDTLAEVLPGFEALNFEYAGPTRWLLRADFQSVAGTLQLYFEELSDGQRALIVLYSILHFLLANGRTVFLDEPDNFISLDEIQPWLLSVTDMVDDGNGQLVLVSHHPEIFDQWALSHGLISDRDGSGPVRIRKFAQATDSGLTPAESVARGWIGSADFHDSSGARS